MADVNTEKHYYIDTDSVPDDIRRLAERVLAHVMRDLGIEKLRIRWVKPTPPHIGRAEDAVVKLARRLGDRSKQRPLAAESEIYGQIGWLTHDVIVVRADLSAIDTARTVAHEAKHIADSLIYRQPQTKEEHRIADDRAYAYEHRAMRELGL